MVEKYLEDYYRGRVRLQDIVKEMDISTGTFYRRLKGLNLHSKGYYYRQIQTGVKELDDTLRTKYHSIIARSKGETEHGNYNDGIRSSEYLTIIEYVEMVNNNKEKLLKMWQTYLNNDKDLKFAISVDRIDSKKPYYKDNMQFTTTGFNSWSRNVRPMKVTCQNKVNYFLSAEEASKFYGIRRQSIGDLLRGINLYSGKYQVEKSTLDEVLQHNQVKTTKEYYETVFTK